MDFNAIFIAFALPVIFWYFIVGAVTLFGYPGVVCITPMAWLLAMTVGQTCIHRSISQTKEMRVREARTAGALLGASQGLLFILISLIGFSIDENEIPRTLLIGSTITLGGTIISAVISAAFANFVEIRQRELAEKNQESPDDQPS